MGQLVDVGGYRLHVLCEGSGSPTVLMEAALWEPGLTWSLVQPKVAAFTRACVYDRAGLGWSEVGPRARSAEVMVEELSTLLRNAGVGPPFVLVAHSWGGILAKLFAHRYGEDVAGMVLVDSAHEEQFLRFPDSIRAAQPAMWEMQMGFLESLRAAIEGGELHPGTLPVPPQLPGAAAEAYRAVMANAGAIETMKSELALTESIHAEVRAAGIETLGDIPLVVLRHGEPIPAFPAELGVTSDDMKQYERTWQELQEATARLSPRGRVGVVEGSGHMIHHDKPDEVVEAIREVVEEARGQAPR